MLRPTTKEIEELDYDFRPKPNLKNAKMKLEVSPMVMLPDELYNKLTVLASVYAVKIATRKSDPEKAQYFVQSLKSAYIRFMDTSIEIFYRLGYHCSRFYNEPGRYQEFHSVTELKKLGGIHYKEILQILIDAKLIMTRKDNYYAGNLSSKDDDNQKTFCKEIWLYPGMEKTFNDAKRGLIACRKIHLNQKVIDVLVEAIGHCKVDYSGVKIHKSSVNPMNFSFKDCKSTEDALRKYYELHKTCEEMLENTDISEDDKLNTPDMNAEYGVNCWNLLTVDDKDLYKVLNLSKNNYKNDPYFLIVKHQLVNNLKKEAVYKNGRFYHPFHNIPKKWRKCLRFYGEKIVELFDIAGSDVKSVAKLYENLADTPEKKKELHDFQIAVQSDQFRKQFGINKKTGKCHKRIKTALKKYFFNDDKFGGRFNTKKEWFDSFHTLKKSSSALRMIDELMIAKYPNIREWITTFKDFWKDMNELETACISNGVCQDLLSIGIPSITCHDAVYVRVSDAEKLKKECISAEKIYNEKLNLKYLKNSVGAVSTRFKRTAIEGDQHFEDFQFSDEMFSDEMIQEFLKECVNNFEKRGKKP